MEDWKLSELAESRVKNCDDMEVLEDYAIEYLIDLYKKDPDTLDNHMERFG